MVVDSGCHSPHGTPITSLFFCSFHFGLLLLVIYVHTSVLNSSKYSTLESFSVCVSISINAWASVGHH